MSNRLSGKKLMERFSRVNPCPEAWEDRGENGYPKSEMGYLRCDFDGYQWFNTAWPVNSEVMTPRLAKELDEVYAAFRKACPNLKRMSKLCWEHAEPTRDINEYNAYLTTELAHYWLRMITRQGDYNLYLHSISRAALDETKGVD